VFKSVNRHHETSRYRRQSLDALNLEIVHLFYEFSTMRTLNKSQHFYSQILSCAISGTAREQLNNAKQNQLKGNRSADIDTDVDGRTRPARQETLMVFVETGDHQGAKHCQNGSAPPERPMFDRHSLKRLPPTIEESETHGSVTNEVTRLADKVMYYLPAIRANWAEKPHPNRI
jgi:hypothetical protein